MRHLTTLFAVVALVGVTACADGAAVVEAPGAPAPAAQESAPTEIIPVDDVAKSQSGSVWQRVANTEITVTYDRPVARGRELFGGIVPFGEIWNPGANDATAIAVSRDVTVDGQPLAAGKYSIWAVPDPSEWTVIFSRAADVYHTPYPGEDQDALRLTVTPQTGSHVETLAFYFAMVEGKDTELRLHWGETIVPVVISVP